MNKFYFPGMQVNSSVRIGTGKSIFQVAFDVKADGCQLCPDLMVAARMKIDPKQMKIV